MKLTPITSDPVGWSQKVAGTKFRVFVFALIHLVFIGFAFCASYWLLQKVDLIRDHWPLLLLTLFWVSFPLLFVGVFMPTLYLYALHRLLIANRAGRE